MATKLNENWDYRRSIKARSQGEVALQDSGVGSKAWRGMLGQQVDPQSALTASTFFRSQRASKVSRRACFVTFPAPFRGKAKTNST